MRFSHVLISATLSLASGIYAAEVTRLHTYHPDGSIASTREIEPLADGNSKVTYIVLGLAGEERTTCPVTPQGHILWVLTKRGERITYHRDEQQRVTEVTWDDLRYSIEYGADGAISRVQVPEGVESAERFRVRWKGLQLVGEHRTTGDQYIFLKDPLEFLNEIMKVD